MDRGPPISTSTTVTAANNGARRLMVYFTQAPLFLPRLRYLPRLSWQRTSRSVSRTGGYDFEIPVFEVDASPLKKYRILFQRQPQYPRALR
jgi:hypothetical protein